MADLKGRFDDAKDKVEGTAKEAQGKVTDDKGKNDALLDTGQHRSMFS